MPERKGENTVGLTGTRMEEIRQQAYKVPPGGWDEAPEDAMSAQAATKFYGVKSLKLKKMAAAGKLTRYRTGPTKSYYSEAELDQVLVDEGLVELTYEGGSAQEVEHAEKEAALSQQIAEQKEKEEGEPNGKQTKVDAAVGVPPQAQVQAMAGAAREGQVTRVTTEYRINLAPVAWTAAAVVAGFSLGALLFVAALMLKG